jgi:hypothetical protein
VQEDGRHFLKLKQRKDESTGEEGGYSDKNSYQVYDHESYIDNIAREISSDDYFDEIMNSDTENTVDFFERMCNAIKENKCNKFDDLIYHLKDFDDFKN